MKSPRLHIRTLMFCIALFGLIFAFQSSMRRGTVSHRVGPAENDWTIVRNYYGSGRFYKAIQQANPGVTEVKVGTVIELPPVRNRSGDN